jgi:ABC-type multidrug transport system ATPase subunit
VILNHITPRQLIHLIIWRVPLTMKYKFYVRKIGGPFPKVTKYPAFVLKQSNWDDYTYRISFTLQYHSAARRIETVGELRILQKGKTETQLPSSFLKLRTNFCSLGNDNKFYERLTQLFEISDIESILTNLNDISFCKGIIEEFEDDPGYKTSLTRYSEAEKAMIEAPKIIRGIKIQNSFDFTFTTKVVGFLSDHVIDFDFKPNSKIPKRIVSFIGKNGSGKTQVMARLAMSLSGLQVKGTFNTDYKPPFSRVIAVSYSLFDKFDIPHSTKQFSYYYCGLQANRKVQSEGQIDRRINSALKEIRSRKDQNIFATYIEEVLGKDVRDRVVNQDTPFKSYLNSLSDEYRNSQYSSGQTILILVIAELISKIRKESLILFDEPETHLHPNAISKFVAIIYRLVEKFDSYAIISTHSPQIIQEIPSSSIYVFSKSDDTPTVRKLDSESFGENLTALTEKIFDTRDVDEYYKTVLRNLAEKYTAPQILKLFEKDGNALSLNARIFLENLYSN